MFYCQATSATKVSSLKMLEADGIRNGVYPGCIDGMTDGLRDSMHPGWRRRDEVGLPRRSRGSLLPGTLPLGRVFMRFLRLQV